MNLKHDCRRQIALVKEAARSPEAAYVARTRLKRLILACNRIIAREHGFPDPILPVTLQLPEAAPQQMQDLLVSCNRLMSFAKSLCQPSEPLDPRWKSEWGFVQAELDYLDDLLARE